MSVHELEPLSPSPLPAPHSIEAITASFPFLVFKGEELRQSLLEARIVDLGNNATIAGLVLKKIVDGLGDEFNALSVQVGGAMPEDLEVVEQNVYVLFTPTLSKPNQV
jgi:hypothetical protein